MFCLCTVFLIAIEFFEIEHFLKADDKNQALAENVNKIDEAFMSVLVAKMNEAEQKDDIPQFQALNEIHALIYAQMEQTLPPHVQFLNQMVRAESADEQVALLNENESLISEELVQMIDQVLGQADGQEEMNGRLQSVKTLIQARL